MQNTGKVLILLSILLIAMEFVCDIFNIKIPYIPVVHIIGLITSVTGIVLLVLSKKRFVR